MSSQFAYSGEQQLPPQLAPITNPYVEASVTSMWEGGGPRYGATSPLGVVGGTLAAQFMNDPAVQNKLAEFQVECKERAKSGVTEWMQENWHWFIVGGAGLIATNYLMLVLGVVPLVGRKRS